MAHERGLDRFLGWRQVRDLTGLGRTTAWRMRQAGDFPDPVPISPGRVAWRERDIAAWNESRGAPIVNRPSAAKPRPSEGRVINAAPAQPATSVAAPPPAHIQSRPARRPRSTVSAGQLRFDF